MGRRSAPATARSAALARAWSTFKQGILVDALGAIGLGLTELLTSADISSEVFWLAVLVLIVKSFLVATASFLIRLRNPLTGAAVPENADSSSLTTGDSSEQGRSPDAPPENQQAILNL